MQNISILDQTIWEKLTKKQNGKFHSTSPLQARQQLHKKHYVLKNLCSEGSFQNKENGENGENLPAEEGGVGLEKVGANFYALH